MKKYSTLFASIVLLIYPFAVQSEYGPKAADALFDNSQKDENQPAYDTDRDFFKFGSSNAKTVKNIEDKQLTPENRTRSNSPEISKVFKLEGNINWERYQQELEYYCSDKLQKIYGSSTFDKDLAEQANKIYSFSKFKQTGQMEKDVDKIREIQKVRNKNRCEEIAINELKTQKSSYEEQVAIKNKKMIEAQEKQDEKNKQIENAQAEKRYIENKKISNAVLYDKEKYCEIKTDKGSYKGSCKLNQDKNVPNGLGLYFNNEIGAIVLGHFQNNGNNSNLEGGLGIVVSYKDPSNDKVYSYKKREIENQFRTCSLNNMKLEELKTQDIIVKSGIDNKTLFFKEPYLCLINFLVSDSEDKSNNGYGINAVEKWIKLTEEEKIMFMNMLIQTLNLYRDNSSNIKNYLNNYLENNYGKFDLDKIIKTKNLNIIKYEKEYLKNNFHISIPKSRLVFKKIEKGSRTVYGNRSSISFFGWGGNDSYDECMRTRRYNDKMREWESCAAVQIPYFNILFKDKSQNLEVVCTNVDASNPEKEFNNIVEWSVGDFVKIYDSIFLGISDQNHIILSNCKGGN